MKLRHLTNDEYTEVVETAKTTGIPIDTCPTCFSVPTEFENSGMFIRNNGRYKYKGQEWNCDCETQIDLRKHYMLSRIPSEYQKLTWEEYDGNDDVIDGVSIYLEKWKYCKHNGIGIEFIGENLGTGKTFAATHIAKELIKKNEVVFFIPFIDILGLHNKSYAEEWQKRMKNSTVLILDEIRWPDTQSQASYFSSVLEEIIRHRSSFDLPTIMTSNLDEDQFSSHYPRISSLLSAKQITIYVPGDDAREMKGKENLEMIINEEIRPLT